ncbi:MAG: nitronate monooxygenase, partial [Caulobacterales bacterium]
MNARDFFAALPIPIIQAPMVGASGAAMAQAVSLAGGLGSLAAGALAPEAIEPAVGALRAAVPGAFAVNLFVISPERPSGETVGAALTRLAPWYAELGLPTPDAPND